MHYKTQVLNMELEPVDRFLKEIGIKELNPQPKLSLTRSSLPDSMQVVLLECCGTTKLSSSGGGLNGGQGKLL